MSELKGTQLDLDSCFTPACVLRVKFTGLLVMRP